MPRLPFSIFQNAPAAQAAKGIVAHLQAAGYEAYFVGGALRDALLGVAPKDVDVATSAALSAVLERFPAAQVVGRAYGACLVRHHTTSCEVVSFRSDGPYADGRHPSWVRPASRREDAQRRDFTLNALYYDPQTGDLYDDVGGLDDLLTGCIRAIGEPATRFGEDYLRLFRALRFAARTGFAIETATFAALCALAGQSAAIAPERVENELTRLLLAPRADLGLTLLAKSGLLAVWLPEVAALQGAPHPAGDAFSHTRRLLDALKPATPELAWAALLHDVGRAASAAPHNSEPFFPGHAGESARLAASVAARLRFSKARARQVGELVARHMTPLDYPALRLAQKRGLFLWPDFPAHLALWRADAVARRAAPAGIDAITADYHDFLAHPALARPLLSGADLLAFGLPPGPLIGRLLARLREAQLAGELGSREEALAACRLWQEEE